MVTPYLSFHPSRSTDPDHVGLIPDGTRRWAKSHNVLLSEAYLLAARTLVRHISFLYEQRIQAISVYLASTGNFQRAPDQVASLCSALSWFCSDPLPRLVKEEQTRVFLAGDKKLLPADVADSAIALQNSTAHHSRRRLYLVAAYSPIQDLLQAFSKTGDPKEVTKHLWVPEPIDIVIRTGGANVLSQFLPLQTGYARIYFTNKLLNDTSTDDLLRILEDFRQVERKYGE